MAEAMRVLYLTSEAHPIIKTGGLADVSGALPTALRQLGVDARLLLPAYGGIATELGAEAVGEPFTALGIPDLRLLRAALPGSDTPLYLLACAALFERDGGPYLDSQGRDWPDNALRFGLLSKVGAMFGLNGGMLGWEADIVHCNDWQSGLTAAYLSYDTAARARTLQSIHNMAFQGNFSHDSLGNLELPGESFASEGLEFYGKVSFLKAGLHYSDRITTVSPTYAREILTAEFGCGMEKLLQKRSDRLSGILNGIDTDIWNPASDPNLPAQYSATDLEAKHRCKETLQQRLGLRVSPAPTLMGVVSRLTSQKGLDLLLGALDEILREPVQLAVLGSGERDLEREFRRLALRYPDRVSVTIGYDEPLSHLIEAGSDLFLMPSRFEPCGLNQMYSMRYGTPPVVRRTGGLADSVVDARPSTLASGKATGFVFERADPADLAACVLRALVLRMNASAWEKVQTGGMSCDFSWERSARSYLEVYNELMSA